MAELNVTLRHPAAVLKPNGARYGHWAVRAKAEREHRTRAHLLALSRMRAEGLETFLPVRYRLSWYYRQSNHRPDLDNALAACKAYLDGCADAFGCNDREWELDGVDRVEDRQRAGWLTLTFSED